MPTIRQTQQQLDRMTQTLEKFQRKANTMRGIDTSKFISGVNEIKSSIESLEDSMADAFEQVGSVDIDLGDNFKRDVDNISKQGQKLGKVYTDIQNRHAKMKSKLASGIATANSKASTLANQSIDNNVNVGNIGGSVARVGKETERLFNTGQYDKAKKSLSDYMYLIDRLNNKVRGATKAKDIATQREVAASKQSQQAQQRIISGERRLNQEQQRTATTAVSSKDKLLNAFNTIASGINKVINKIISIVRTGVAVVSKIFNGLVKSITIVKSTMTRLLSIFGGFGNRVKMAFRLGTAGANNTGKAFNGLKGSAVELYAKIRLLQMGFEALFNNRLMEKAKELYASVYSLKNIAGPQITQDTIDWANSMERAFGLSAKSLIADINELTGVLYGLGMTAEHVATGSQNILIMSRYLGFMGAAGGDIDQVMSKMTSGMKGMTQAIDDLGLSARTEEMNSYLESLKAQGGEFANIETSFENLNEEARVYVRYASLMEQFSSKYDITKLVDSLDTTTGRVTLLKDAFGSLGATIGQIFLKAIASVAPYLKLLVGYIENALAKIAKLFGIDITVSESMNDGEFDKDNKKRNKGLNETEKNLNKVGAAAKKAKGSLSGFDRIESINTSSSSSGGSGGVGGSGFDYSTLMTDILEGLNEKAKNAETTYMDKIKEKWDTKVEEMIKKFNEFAKEVTGRDDFDIEFNWESAKGSLKNIVNNLGAILKNSGITVITIGLKVADDLDIGLIINRVLELIESISQLARVVTGKLNPVLSELYDKHLSKYVVIIGDWLVKELENLISIVDRLRNGFVNGNIDEVIRDMREEFAKFRKEHPSIDKIVSIFENLYKVGKTLLKDVLIPLAKSFGSFAKNDFLPWLNTNLEKLGVWLEQHKEQLVDLIKKVGSFSWAAFEKFVTIMGKLVDFAVNHPNAVIGFLGGLLGLKVAGWALGAAAGIGHLVKGLGELKGMSGLLSIIGLGGKGATAAAGASTGASGGLLAGLATALPTVAAVVAAVVALGASFADIWNDEGSEKFRETFTGFLSTVKSEIGKLLGALGGLKDSLGGLMGELKPFYESVLKPLLKVVFTVAGFFVKGTITMQLGLLTTAFEAISTAIEVVTDILSGLKDVIVGMFSGDMEKMFNGSDKLGDALISMFDGIGDTILGVIRSIFHLLGESVVDGFTSGVIAKWGNMIEWFRGKWDGLVQIVKNVLGINSPSKVFYDIGGFLIEGLIQGVNAIWGEFIGGVVSKFSNAKESALATWSDVKVRFGGVANDIVGAFGTMRGKLSNLWVNIKADANSILSGIGSGITSVIEKAKKKVSDGIEQFTVKYENTSAKIKTIPGFYNGGMPKGGQLFYANESGNPELVGNFGSGTGVANNSMIIESMRKAIGDTMAEAVYNGMASVHNQTGGSNGKVDVHIAENGLFVGDDSTRSELARILAPYLKGNNLNIADLDFGI